MTVAVWDEHPGPEDDPYTVGSVRHVKIELRSRDVIRMGREAFREVDQALRTLEKHLGGCGEQVSLGAGVVE